MLIVIQKQDTDNYDSNGNKSNNIRLVWLPG